MVIDPQTIRAFRRMLFDLALVGEIDHTLVKWCYGLSPAKVLLLGKSGWVAITPYSLVATPYLLHVLPVTTEAELIAKLGLPDGENMDARRRWAALEDFETAMTMSDVFDDPNKVLSQLGLGYDYIGIGLDQEGRSLEERFLENGQAVRGSDLGARPTHIARPIFLYPYVPLGIAVHNWDVRGLDRLSYVFRQRNCHVFSTLPFYGLPEAHHWVWDHPFYWLVIQLLVLSDPETGAAYEFKTSLHMPHGFDDRLAELTAVNVYLDGTLVTDFLGILDEALRRMNCVWVNREREPRKLWPQVMSLFRLLYKLGILERWPDSRLGLTGEFRRRLYEKNDYWRQRFGKSKDARETIREIIMTMAASQARNGESQQTTEAPV